MLHAAAMFIGLTIVWLLFTQRWNGAEDVGLAFAVAGFALLAAARFGGVRGNSFAHIQVLSGLAFGQIADVARGATRTIRAAIAADVTLKPALVRVRTKTDAGPARAALIGALSAAPGSVVVDGDAESLLVHVLDEDRVDSAEVGRLEGGVLRGISAGAP